VILIGLTGGIASGKSTVAEMLRAKGAVIVDADVIGQRTYASGGPAHERIVARFGDEVVAEDGEIDRAKLASLVFSDDAALADLNEITHPLILEEAMRQVEEHRDSDRLVVLDAALLVEIFGDRGRSLGLQALVVVIATPDQQRARLAITRGMAEDDAQARMDAQGLIEAKMAAADFIIDNREGPEELRAAVDRLWDELQSMFSDSPSSN